MKITFEAAGGIKFIYDDAVAEVAKEVGALTIKRASHVEPDEKGDWWADMDPVGGPQLGPFRDRTGALLAERVWLIQHNMPRPK